MKKRMLILAVATLATVAVGCGSHSHPDSGAVAMTTTPTAQQAAEADETALVSFRSMKSPAFVKELAQTDNLRVIGLFEGFIAETHHTAAYGLQDGQSLDDAITKFESTMRSSLQHRIESDRAVSAPGVVIADDQQHYDALQTRGLQFFGIQVAGSSKAIAALEQHPDVAKVQTGVGTQVNRMPGLLINGGK